MGALVADLDPLATRADEVLQRGVQVDLVAHLVKVGHGLFAALADRAAVGRQLTQDDLQQGRFARPIGPDQTDLVAAQDGAGEIADHHALPAIGGGEGFADLLQLGHDLPAGGAAGHFQFHAAQGIAALLALGAQAFQPGDATLRPGAPGFHALADPHLFLRKQLVGAGVDDSLLGQLLFFQQLVLGEVAGVAQQASAVQFHHPGRNTVQKRPIVADGDDAPFVLQQKIFKPCDAVQIQVVGGLVQQQHVGSAHQGLCQGHTLLIAARKRADRHIRLQVQAVKRLLHPLFPVPGVQCLDAVLQGIQIEAVFTAQIEIARGASIGQTHTGRLEHRALQVQHWLLRYIGDAQTGLCL